ncbi:antigen-presenting glycoprotein CD1d isoform X3 [Macaca nemestrina]|uniref:antigen-presenting glycoprotein CD1d isoform X3 n=1 Tax=Macaca nemestrina TaxID=9545 RepID=UPI0039B95622
MGCLLFLLLWALLQAWGSAEVPQRLFPLRCLQISSFANSNWTRTDGLAWLGELQTHSWSNDSDTIRSLKPWSQGTFSDQQWEALQRVFRVYRSSFTRDVKEFAKMLRLAYPMELQVSAGCEVHPGNASHNFFHVAFQGSDILSFQGTSWEPAQEAPLWVNLAIQVLNQDKWTKETVQWLLNDTCPQFVSGLLESGKSELEKQGQPVFLTPCTPLPGSKRAFPFQGSHPFEHSKKRKAQEGLDKGEAQGLAVPWPQSWPWPSAACVPCLRILPKARVGEVDAG